jgi:hypothetical protein
MKRGGLTLLVSRNVIFILRILSACLLANVLGPDVPVDFAWNAISQCDRVDLCPWNVSSGLLVQQLTV